MREWLLKKLGLLQIYDTSLSNQELLQRLHSDILELRVMVAEMRTTLGLEPGIHPVTQTDKLLELTSFDPIGL